MRQYGGRLEQLPDGGKSISLPSRDLETSAGWYEFDIHGYAALRVARDAPSAAILLEMFEPFRTEGLEAFDLTVTGAVRPTGVYSVAETRFRYTPTSVRFRRGHAEIALLGSGAFHLSGKGELLTRALPLLDIALARKGAAMIHSAAFEYKGQGVALPAWGGTGKTGAMARLALQPDGAFMSDDWAFLSGDKRLLGFAKPMFLKPHHRLIYPELFSRKRKVLVPAAFSGLLGKLATAVHPAVTRFPRVATVTRRWSPEHMTIKPGLVFPRVARSAPLAAVIFMERFSGDRVHMQERSTDWMVARLVGNFYAEMPSASREVLAALAGAGLVPLPAPFSEKAAVIRGAIAESPAFLLRIPSSLPIRDASERASGEIMQALAKWRLV